MRRATRLACFVACLVPTVAQGAPLSAYGMLPTLEDVEISPDGKDLAYLGDIDGHGVIVISSADSGALIDGMSTGDQKMRDLRWADNDHLLITASTWQFAEGLMGPRREYWLTKVYSLSSKSLNPLIRGIDDALNSVTGLPQPRVVDGHTKVLVRGTMFLSDYGSPALFGIDLDTGHAKTIDVGTADTLDWLVDSQGNAVAEVDYKEGNQTWELYVKHGDVWVRVFHTVAAIDLPWIDGITPSGESLIISVPSDGTVREWQFNLMSGRPEPVFQLGAGRQSVVEDPSTHRIIGSEFSFATTSYVFFDPSDDNDWKSVEGAFPGENVDLVSWSSDRKKIVVRVDGLRDGAAYFVVDLNAHKATRIGPVYRGIDPSAVAEVKLISYHAVDGLEIPAYLTLPRGRTPKNLPLIVLPHRGPAVRDMPEFDWWSQALASRGYVVLQPEFRGSDGFGWKHLSAGFGEWGRKMQTDLSDGVRFLAAQGVIDPKRVCIVGASYGGYAALAGATLDRGVYRCAVSVSGISDPHNFLRWRQGSERSSDSDTLRYWNRFMGTENLDDLKLGEISPLAHTAGVDAPILLIHGKQDSVVPISQSEEMADALKAAGKPYRLVELDGEDHWLSRSETRLQMLTEMVTFLEANNPPN